MIAKSLYVTLSRLLGMGALVEEQMGRLSEERLSAMIQERVGEDLNWIRERTTVRK